MRHQVGGYKLTRDSEHRWAMRRNLAASLFMHGQITTTVPKAKSVKPFVEKLITAAKKGDLASRRRVVALLGRDRIIVKNDKDADVKRNKYGEVVGGPKLVKRIFDEIAPRYADRTGGYTRIIRLARHKIGDGSDLCVLQLVGQDEQGPQVAGQFSRRREKANYRMEFAARLRKEGQKSEGAAEAAATAEAGASGAAGGGEAGGNSGGGEETK